MNYIKNKEVAKEIAQGLLEIKAIKLRPNDMFTWASGIKSPIYCDNRISLSYPKLRKKITLELVNIIKEFYPSIECIAGVATAGIPQGVLVADALELPFIYVRSKAKGHGMTNLIEGNIVENQKVVVIEDLISTGGSSLKAVDDLRNNNINVLGMVSIFTYGFEIANKNFIEKKCSLVCLSDYSSLLEITDTKYSDSDSELLKKWKDNV